MKATAGSLAADQAAIRATHHEFIDAPFPDTVWLALETLYASVYSSQVQLASQCRGRQVSAWIERSGGSISALLLYTREGAVVRVLNQVLHLPEAVIRRFALAIFMHDAQAHLVQLHAVFIHREESEHRERASDDQPRLLTSAFSEDYALKLPATHEQWLAALSRQTREKVRYHLRRSFRRQPGLAFSVTSSDMIADEDVQAVLKLNRERMRRKGKSYGMSAAEEDQLRKQMQQVGLLCVLRLDGVICAGLLCSVSGGDVYMHVIAHDPRYDDLRLGLVCCCLTIRHLIEHQYSQFHFLWGHYDYKRRLGGRALPLYRVMVPRSALSLWRHPLSVGRWWAESVRDALRRWRQPAVARERSC